MSRRPASCRLVQFVSVLPRREYRMNSRISVPRNMVGLVGIIICSKCCVVETPIYVVVVIVCVVDMTTISVTDEVKEKLLKIASELQIKLGRRVDLDEALRYLLSEREKKPWLLEEACKPLSGAKEMLDELYRERKLDEERLERKIGGRRKRSN